jgi:glutathione peroxidase
MSSKTAPAVEARIPDLELRRLNGQADQLGAHAGEVLLIVNVASRCGKTPQYAGLQALYDRYREQGLTVLGFPCNQFGREEPGSASDIEAFCALNYGVTFPIFEKTRVNGRTRHPLYRNLTAFPDDTGEAGDVQWNFEKFLVGRDGVIARRFRPSVVPDDTAIVEAIEDLLEA